MLEEDTHVKQWQFSSTSSFKIVGLFPPDFRVLSSEPDLVTAPHLVNQRPSKNGRYDGDRKQRRARSGGESPSI